MITIREMIIFSAVTIVQCQYDYFRPDIRANELDLNLFRQPFATDDGSRSGAEIPGKAGTDYPVFSKVPETGFRCDQQRYPGYYADQGTGCQAFHICQRGGRTDSFLCPNGTIFNQEWLVCDWWYNFDCSRAQNFFSVNEQVVRSMDEADTRLQDYRYKDFRNFGNGLSNRQFDSQGFPNFRTGVTPLNNENVLPNGPYAEYGAPGFERNSGPFDYNRRASDFRGFVQRNSVFGSSGAPGFPEGNGYQRNLFRTGDGTLERTYLPPGK